MGTRSIRWNQKGFRELYVPTDKGAMEVRDYKRKPETERWNRQEFAGVQGLPWEPVLVRHLVEVKSHVQHREEEEVAKLPRSRGSITR